MGVTISSFCVAKVLFFGIFCTQKEGAEKYSIEMVAAWRIGDTGKS